MGLKTREEGKQDPLRPGRRESKTPQLGDLDSGDPLGAEGSGHDQSPELSKSYPRGHGPLVPRGAPGTPNCYIFQAVFSAKLPLFTFWGQFWHFFRVRPDLLQNVRKIEKACRGQPRGPLLIPPAGGAAFPGWSLCGWRRKSRGIHSLPAPLFCALTPNGIFFFHKPLGLGELVRPTVHIEGIYFKDDRNQQDGCPQPAP